MVDNYDFAVAMRKIGEKKGLDVVDEALLSVQRNNRQCLCDLSKSCPCQNISEDGCPCGLFVPKV